jgi:surfeit locus 1 family protein
VTYAQSAKNGMIELNAHLQHSELLEYQKAHVKGVYETKYQILIDNQVEQNQAGYHVITPLKIEGSTQYVLVNRGWIPGNTNHADVPKVETPQGKQEVEGMVWIPTKKIFSLESSPSNQDSQLGAVWQNLDMQKYQQYVPLPILPVIIKLAPENGAGGFVRNWQPPQDRIVMHLGYAYQWFGFAVAAVLIFLFTSIKRVEK